MHPSPTAPPPRTLNAETLAILEDPQSARYALHLSAPLAWVALGVSALYTLLGVLWSPAVLLAYTPFCTLAVLDWHRLVTHHGRIPWRRWWSAHPIWVGVGVTFLGLLVAMVLPFAYLLKCLESESALRAEVRRRTADRIAALEAELAADASTAPQLSSGT